MLGIYNKKQGSQCLQIEETCSDTTYFEHYTPSKHQNSEIIEFPRRRSDKRRYFLLLLGNVNLWTKCMDNWIYLFKFLFHTFITVGLQSFHDVKTVFSNSPPAVLCISPSHPWRNVWGIPSLPWRRGVGVLPRQFQHPWERSYSNPPCPAHRAGGPHSRLTGFQSLPWQPQHSPDRECCHCWWCPRRSSQDGWTLETISERQEDICLWSLNLDLKS